MFILYCITFMCGVVTAYHSWRICMPHQFLILFIVYFPDKYQLCT